MKNLFECKVKYLVVDDNGKDKVFNENYLVDAVSFTDAEARITEEVSQFVTGDFSVMALKIAHYNELIMNDGDSSSYYKAKVTLIMLDEARGVEKRSSVNVLAEANDVKMAHEMIADRFNEGVSDYAIDSIVDSKLSGVFIKEKEEDI